MDDYTTPEPEKDPQSAGVEKGGGSNRADVAIAALMEIAKGQEYAASDRIAAAELLLTLTVQRT
jgi:hypothetical protein